MSDLDARFAFGSLLVAFGVTYVLAHFAVIPIIWTFLGFFLIFEGTYYTIKKIYSNREDFSGYLSMLFIGISILLFTFNIIQYSFPALLASLFISVGLALLISGGLLKFIIKETIYGIVLICIGTIFLLPSVFHISENFYKFVRIYGFGGLFILLGIIIILPGKGDKKK